MKISLSDFFQGNFDNFDTTDGQVYFQTLFINVLSIIGVIPLASFSIYNIFFGIQILGIIEAMISATVILNLFLFRRHKNVKTGSIAILLTMILLSLVLLTKGGIENTGLFWLYIFPVLAFFLQGARYGFLWVLFYIAMNLSLAILAEYGLFTLSFSFIEIRQFLLSLLTLSAMIYFYQRVIESMNKSLKESNLLLEERVSKELHKNREKDYLLLRQSRQAQMGEMIAMIAHQWRQPLASISATVGSLQLKQIMGIYEKEYFDMQLKNIADYSQHLSETIDDFRDFFKEDKQMYLTTLEEIMESSLSIMRPILEAKNITLTIDFGLHEKFFTHPNELKQVVLNLLKNAQEAFIQAKTADPRITISTYKDEDRMCFHIEDNAGGVPADIIDKVFDPYFTTKGELHGSGLGLYMSQKIVNEHCSGSIEVKNTNEGARFICKMSKVDNVS